MADVQYQPIGTRAAPNDWVLPNSAEFTLKCARASFDGTGAAQSWLPALEVLSDAGTRVGLYPVATAVAAGASADVSFFPWSRHRVTAAATTYAQRIIILKSQYTCVAEWQLDEGAVPYADTSGFAPGDPATLTRVVHVTPMTQNYASGPLSIAPAGPSVAFNYDGDANSGSGDLLHAIDTTPSRYYFAGTLPFTVVAWVIPGAGVNTHYGPVVGVVHTTGGTRDDGWRINVNEPDLTPQFQRVCAATTLGQYDTVAGNPLPTSAWTMLVGTYDGATMRFYINGLQVGATASAGSIGGAANNAQIGEGPHLLGDYGTWYFGGASQLSVWAATFTAQDVADLYASR